MTRRYLVLLAVCVLACLPALGQSSFSARVVDAETGEALPLVGIYISEENNTLTNFDGEFCIVADSSDVLRISCVGRRSLRLRASELPEVVQMQMLESTLSEVTVQAYEGTLLQVARRMEKAFGRKRGKTAQYFYRQTSILTQKQDIVEAFIGAHSAVNLRGMEFLTGRHGALSAAAWAKSAISEMNLHHVLELGPMTKDAAFWNGLIVPLPSAKASTGMRASFRKEGEVGWPGLPSGIEYLQRYYDISIDEMDDEGRKLYRIILRRNEKTEVKTPMMTGTLYVEKSSLNVLAFDGQVENLVIRFGKGELRSATTVPVTLAFHIDYRYDHKYPEVANLSMQAGWGDFQTRTLLFNVEGQKRLKHKKGTSARENMLGSLASAGYDSTFWANNEVVKRTAEEVAIAAGTVERQQARIDSVAAYQASLSPLERMADRLERFGKLIPQEKVYVHMDNTCYFLGDTIWFAAYTRKTNTDTPSRMSRVLYCELWNHDGYLVERKLVEMKDGRGHGFFALPDTLYSGYFELRAYTRWQLNWGQTEHFHSKQTEYWFYNRAMAKDFFRDYEKLYSRVFPVYDKPKQAGDFYRDMTLRPLRRYFKSAPKPAELRLSLFPEGGNLVAGIPCRVAFEAATSEGEVREGTLSLYRKRDTKKNKKPDMALHVLNGRGERVQAVYTENRGRSTFTFTPEEGVDYEAVFTATDTDVSLANGRPERVTQVIKAVRADGVALQVQRAADGWQLDIAARGSAASQPLGLTLMHEGNLTAFHRLELGGAQADTLLSLNDQLPTGVNQVTVFDSLGHVYADRLFFVTTPGLMRPTLEVAGMKDQYAPFEVVELDVHAADSTATGEKNADGKLRETFISLSVRDAMRSDNTFDSGNILTEMLLSSEIKGFVPQPEYFFERDDEEHQRALDLLMMTQGWRRFNWQDMAVKGTWDITHPAEHTPMVTGTVNRYMADLSGFDAQTDVVASEHLSFMTRYDVPLSDQNRGIYYDPMNASAPGSGGSFPSFGSMGAISTMGRPGFGWKLTPDRERSVSDFFHSGGHLLPFQSQRAEWQNDDYNVLSYRTANRYRMGMRNHRGRPAYHYLEEGNVKKDVRVHAEFINMEDNSDYLVGETDSHHGRFQIDLPRFEGYCVFFLTASDTTKWKKNTRHQWVEVDPTTEYSSMPLFPEYYVRLNFPYPRWVKPYTFYQVHNAPRRDNLPLSSNLRTDGVSLLNEVTVRARHGGLRRIDFSKPAYVLDAYDACNLAMDAGLIDYTFSAYEIGTKAAMSLIGDMGMERRYTISTSYGTQRGNYVGYLDQRRQQMLTYTDKVYIYTDYSPRREGDERFEQSNQPEVRVDLRPFSDQGMRVTYRDRRYILPGFAYQADFYHPDYKRNPPAQRQMDYRRTLYWNPALKLDVNGCAKVRLFNGSRAASIVVEAAGQTEEGGLLY